jgi:peptide deformylase
MMTLRNIVTPPNPTLRKKATKVRSVTPAVQTLADDMVETMRAAPGVGLAAPQVDVSQRVIVVEYAESNEEMDVQEAPPKLFIVINPKITRRSRETLIGTEGCLSLPGLMGDVERHEWVLTTSMVSFLSTELPRFIVSRKRHLLRMTPQSHVPPSCLATHH